MLAEETQYDTLVVAGGSRYSLGHDDWMSLAPELKSRHDLDIRNGILTGVRAAEVEATRRDVGAG